VEPAVIWGAAAVGTLAGLLGAKVYGVLVALPQILRGEFSIWHAGQVWYGAVMAAIPTTIWWFHRTRTPLRLLLDYHVVPFTLGHAVARVGCFLVGDDYGVPTNGPLGVAFPLGLPPTTAGNLRAMGAHLPATVPDAQLLAVHPTQLYEVAALGLIGALLWHRSCRPHRRWSVFALYLLLYGSWRFAIEFVRLKDDHVPIGLTSAQVVSLVLVAVGAWLLRRSSEFDVPRITASHTHVAG
jgi:phosphatidylglycerol:prolipoprotein diacylglycerol transferase